MDHEKPNYETDSWVDERMASLDPPAGWNPDVNRAYRQLAQPKAAATQPRWMQLSLAGVTLAATVAVLALLPWGSLWQPQQPDQVEAPNAETEETTPVQKPALASAKALPRPKEPSLAAAAAQSGTTAPVVLTKVIPKYTEEAKAAKIQGTVEVEITINTDGTVTFEGIKTGLGYGLDESAQDAVVQWTFMPGTKDGVPVRVRSVIQMHFGLK